MNQYMIEHAIANALDAVADARSDETLRAAATIMRERIAMRADAEMKAWRELQEKKWEIERELGA